ncbi:glycosyltransferase family 2 protein, partial [Echinicola sediminis]
MAEYISTAVNSATILSEVGEVILVEDGSSDKSLEVCNQLEMDYVKVKLLRHPGEVNKGVSASRNLGIRSAKFPWVAFLDADDWYMPHRFNRDKLLFSEGKVKDGMYSCAILETDQDDLTKRYGVKKDPRKLIGKEVSSLEFYKIKLKKKWVLFHTNTLTIKRDFLLKEKLFDIRLKLHEDSELWNRLLRRGDFSASEVDYP